jgi:hypothetical protein
LVSSLQLSRGESCMVVDAFCAVELRESVLLFISFLVLKKPLASRLNNLMLAVFLFLPSIFARQAAVESFRGCPSSGIP